MAGLNFFLNDVKEYLIKWKNVMIVVHFESIYKTVCMLGLRPILRLGISNGGGLGRGPLDSAERQEPPRIGAAADIHR